MLQLDYSSTYFFKDCHSYEESRENGSFSRRIDGKYHYVEVGGDSIEESIIEVYDLESGAWSNLGPTPIVFTFPNFLIHEDEIYMFTR